MLPMMGLSKLESEITHGPPELTGQWAEQLYLMRTEIQIAHLGMEAAMC